MSIDRPDLGPGHARAVRSRTTGLWAAEPFDPADPTDMGNPNYYQATAGSWVEQVLRADFTRYHQLQAAAARSNSTAEIDALTARATWIETSWLRRDNSWSQTWRHAVEVRDDWLRAPEAMARRLGAFEEERSRGWHALTDIELRTLHHVRELTGDGSGDHVRNPTDSRAAQILDAAFAPELPNCRALDAATADSLGDTGSGQVLDEGPGR